MVHEPHLLHEYIDIILMMTQVHFQYYHAIKEKKRIYGLSTVRSKPGSAFHGHERSCCSLIRKSVVCMQKREWAQGKCLWACEKDGSTVSFSPLSKSGCYNTRTVGRFLSIGCVDLAGARRIIYLCCLLPNIHCRVKIKLSKSLLKHFGHPLVYWQT